MNIGIINNLEYASNATCNILDLKATRTLKVK